MKVLFCVALVAVLSFVSAKPDGSSETEATEEDPAKKLQEYFDLLANQEKLEQSQNLAAELEPVRLYLALGVAFFVFHDDETVKQCTDKFGVTETETSQADFTSSDLPEKLRCALQCVGEQEQVWADNKPAGLLLLWKQFSDVVLGKYSDLNEDLTQLAQQGRECMTYEETEKCTGFVSVLNCIQKLVADD